MQQDDLENDSLLQFPCEFPIKVFGKATHEFEITVLKILSDFYPLFGNEHYTKRMSSDNHYLALSINLYVKSKDELDLVYQALHDAPDVIMVL